MSLTKDNQMIADSSFYLCFLEDIKKPDVLISVLDKFELFIPPLVCREISVSSNFNTIQTHPKLTRYNGTFGEALRPFFSEKQVQKGETEVIGLAYDFFIKGNPKRIILDDKQARSFVQRHLPELQKLLTGTIGFVGDCYCKYTIFEKDYTRSLVMLIRDSPFRVPKDVISEVLDRINSSG